MQALLTHGEWLYNIAAGLGFMAYLMSNVLWLRILLVIGAAVYIYTGIVLQIDSMIGWHVAYGLINFLHVIIILVLRSHTELPDAISGIYTDQFHLIRPREFKRLVEVNASGRSGPSVLLKQGEQNKRIYLIVDGEVIIDKNGKHVARCQRGDFIGEMSVLTGRAVSSSVIVADSVRYVYWDREDLQKIEKANLSVYNQFMLVISRNLAEKLRSCAQGYALKLEFGRLP